MLSWKPRASTRRPGRRKGRTRAFRPNRSPVALRSRSTASTARLAGEFGLGADGRVDSRQAQHLAEVILGDQPLAEQEAALMRVGAFTPRPDHGWGSGRRLRRRERQARAGRVVVPRAAHGRDWTPKRGWSEGAERVLRTRLPRTSGRMQTVCDIIRRDRAAEPVYGNGGSMAEKQPTNARCHSQAASRASHGERSSGTGPSGVRRRSQRPRRSAQRRSPSGGVRENPGTRS